MIVAPPQINSIKEILPEDCYKTRGSEPVKVYCDDGHDYICKYFKGQGMATGLFNEYLAAIFGKIWGLEVQNVAFVKIHEHHTEQITLPKYFFEVPCFGSLYGKNLKEVDKIFLGWPARKNKMKVMVQDYLKIGLFDIWLSNDDRNFDNFNLLFDPATNHLVPIDHVQIFNGNNLDKEPYQISETDSILTTPFLNGIFSRTLQQNFNEFRLTIESDFISSIKNCRENLDVILDHTPPEWRIDRSFVRLRLETFFSEDWQRQCLTTFNQFIHYTLNRRQ